MPHDVLPAGVRRRKAYADAHTGQVHYRDMGEGDRVILMLHQSPSSSLQFEASWPRLTAAGFRVLAMDTPGFGMSDVPPFEPSIADYAKCVPAVLDHAGVARAALVGHHTGVEIAFEAAGLFPERVTHLIGHGVPLFQGTEAREWWERVVPREQTPLQRDPEGRYLQERFARGVHDPSPEMLYVRERCLLETLSAGPMYWYGHSAAFLYDLRPRLETLQLPMLFITNTGDMIHEETLRAHAVRPDAELVQLEGGTINIVDEQPDAWSAAIVEFLDRHR